MPRRTERRLLLVLGAVAALLVAATVTSFVSLDRAFDDLQRAARAHELIARLRSAHLAVADIERGLCGHLLTGDKALLEPSGRIRAAMRRHLERAAELAADDPSQRVRIERLAVLVDARIRTMDAAVAGRASAPGGDASVAAGIAAGSRQMDEIHDALGEILEAAEKEIAVRTKSQETAARAKTAAFAGIAACALLLLGGGYLLVRRELALRRSAEARLLVAKHEAEDVGRELESFSYSIAHDLRAPLRAIDGFAQALLEDNERDLDATGKDHLRRIRAASQRMGTLIDDLLSLARITRSELVREDVDLSALARSVLDDLRAAEPARDVADVVAPGLAARGDRRLLRVALENLLGNAWKYTSKKPRARIEFSPAGAEPHAFVVRDDGAGFDMAYADRLFGSFQRLHTQDEFPGTGIGLATVQRIVHRHGGRVWAEGRVGEGASFSFTLPPDPGESAAASEPP